MSLVHKKGGRMVEAVIVLACMVIFSYLMYKYATREEIRMKEWAERRNNDYDKEDEF